MDQENFQKAIDKASLATTIKAADTWKLPLVGALTNHAHHEGCDKVLTEGVADCDCWWQDVWDALKGMEDVADLARAELAQLEREA